MNTSKIALFFFALLSIASIGCASPEAVTCSPCGDGAIVCSGTVAECIADGNGVCETGGPGGLTLAADGTFRQEFGAYAQTGTYVQTSNNLQLTSGGQVVGNVSVAEFGTCQIGQ